jgi:hypothetical protein
LGDSLQGEVIRADKVAKSKNQDGPAVRASGSRFSRRRIIVAAGVLVLLVGLSWITLGLLNKTPEEPPKPEKPIATKITGSVTIPESTEQPSSPPPESPAPAKPEPPAAPEQPETAASTAAPKPQPEEASKPGADTFVLPQPKAPTLEEQTRVLNEIAENGKPATAPKATVAKTPEKPVAGETAPPTAETQPKPSAETPSVPTGPSVQAKVPFQVLDQADIPSAQPPAAGTEPKTPATAPDITAKTGFPPPGETPPAGPPTTETPSATAPFPPPETGSEEKMVTELPRPKWQTMDKDWEKVEIEEAPPVEALKARDSNWKQMDVGQEETAKAASETPLPEAIKEPPPATEEAASETGEKPGEQPGSTVASKTHQPVVKKSTKTSAKSTKSTKSSQTAKRRVSSGSRTGTPSLRIINETGRPGQGQVYRDVLAAMGYRVNKIEDRPARSGPTTIMYSPGLRNQAVNLARRLPGKRSVAPSRESVSNEIVIVVR